jgi:hypothetical protein
MRTTASPPRTEACRTSATGDEHAVAGGVAERSLTCLKRSRSIDRRRGAPADPREHPAQRAAVGGAGQVVEVREAVGLRAGREQLLVDHVDLGHVEDAAVEVAAPVLGAHAPAVADPAQDAVGADQAVVDVEPADVPSPVVRAVEGLEVVGMDVVAPDRIAGLLHREPEELLAAGPGEDEAVAAVEEELPGVDVLLDGPEDAGERRVRVAQRRLVQWGSRHRGASRGSSASGAVTDQAPGPMRQDPGRSP